jgi:hypothetical protein
MIRALLPIISILHADDDFSRLAVRVFLLFTYRIHIVTSEGSSASSRILDAWKIARSMTLYRGFDNHGEKSVFIPLPAQVIAEYLMGND